MTRGRTRPIGRSGRTALQIALALLLAVTSCADEGGPISIQAAYTTCSEDAECAFYLTCREGTCRFRCASEADCGLLGSNGSGPRFTCQDGACMPPVTNE